MANWQTLTNEELVKMPTKRLYNIYKQLQYISPEERYHAGSSSEYHKEARAKRDFIKSVLDTREHIDRVKIHKPKSNRGWLERLASWINKPKKEHRVHIGPIKDLNKAIGKQVFKKTGKPFKSKNIYNTVKSVTTNPHTKREAFTFEEDSSIVDAYICDLRK